jgi:hypothetical protein
MDDNGIRFLNEHLTDWHFRPLSGFKETAFLYAISSAGLVHAFARACSSGTLDRCTCGKTKSKNMETWKLGGCGDNIKFGTRFSRRFLKARDTDSKSEDFRAKVDEHNTNVGLRVSNGANSMANVLAHSALPLIRRGLRYSLCPRLPGHDGAIGFSIDLAAQGKTTIPIICGSSFTTGQEEQADLVFVQGTDN